MVAVVRVLAHFLPAKTVLEMVAPEADWLDIRWCHEDDDQTLGENLPWADAVWHVLRPLSGNDLRRGARLRLVHKLGAGVLLSGLAWGAAVLWRQRNQLDSTAPD